MIQTRNGTAQNTLPSYIDLQIRDFLNQRWVFLVVNSPWTFPILICLATFSVLSVFIVRALRKHPLSSWQIGRAN